MELPGEVRLGRITFIPYVFRNDLINDQHRELVTRLVTSLDEKVVICIKKLGEKM